MLSRVMLSLPTIADVRPPKLPPLARSNSLCEDDRSWLTNTEDTELKGDTDCEWSSDSNCTCRASDDVSASSASDTADATRGENDDCG